MKTPEITKSETSGSNGMGRFTGYFFVALIVFTYFFGLTIPFVGPDEPRYAQVAREMFERGDWITPTLGGALWFEKPALFYWFEMVGYSLFGVNEFAARFGAAICGLGTIASLWILGRVVEKNALLKNTAIKGFAFYLGIVAASTIGIIVFSRGASFDIVITFPITASLASFFIFDLRERDDRATRQFLVPISLFYFFIGIALLAKGLIGIVFPFAIVGSYYLISRRPPSRAFLISLVWGSFLAFAIASAWYLPMYFRHGYRFIDEFIIQHHFQRFTSNKYQHPQPFYFFFWVLPLMTLPWLPFFISSIFGTSVRFFRNRPVSANDDKISERHLSDPTLGSLLKFVFIWMAIPVLFFSFSGSKLPGYVLPALPPSIIITTFAVFRFAQKSRFRGVIARSTAIGFLLLSVFLVAFVVPKYADANSVKGLITAADSRGYADQMVMPLHTISHNAEFYAAGRLPRTDDGKQKKLYSPAEIASEMHTANTVKCLVLVPIEYLKQITTSDMFHSEWIRDNGELAIVEVTLK